MPCIYLPWMLGLDEERLHVVLPEEVLPVPAIAVLNLVVAVKVLQGGPRDVHPPCGKTIK